MAYTNSKTWVSPQMAEQERWGIVSSNLRRMRFDRSPFVPRQFSEWIQHRAQYTAIQTEQEKRRLAHVEATRTSGFEAGQYEIMPAFGGNVFNDGRSAVLGQLTIWSVWTEGPKLRQLAYWPGRDELKEEGDERHTSDFTRFLPIPRVPGNETVAWKQKALVRAHYLDYVLPIGTIKWTDDTRVKEAMEIGIEVSSDEIVEGIKETDDKTNRDTKGLTLSNPTDKESGDYTISGTNLHVPLDVIVEEDEEAARSSICDASVTTTYDWNRSTVDERLLEQYRAKLAEYERARIGTTLQAPSYPRNYTRFDDETAGRGSRRGINVIGDGTCLEGGKKDDVLESILPSTTQPVTGDRMPYVSNKVSPAIIQNAVRNSRIEPQTPSESTMVTGALPTCTGADDRCTESK